MTEKKLIELLGQAELLVERMKNALNVLRKNQSDNSVTVLIERINDDIPYPRYMSEGAAGMDICAEITTPLILPANQKEPILIGTGLKVAIPKGYQISVRPRSGMGKKGIYISNSPGLIDSDYRGEIMMMLQNLSNNNHTIEPGDRIGQILLEKVYNIEWLPCEELPITVRGTGGFGSTGK